MARFDRRRREAPKRRVEEPSESVEDVVAAFERLHGVKVEEMDLGAWRGKRLRGLLLVALKDRARMTYAEIAKLPPSRNLKASSLAQLYRRARRRRTAS